MKKNSGVRTKSDYHIAALIWCVADGYNLIKVLRGMPKKEGGEIPAIAFTPYAGESDRWVSLSSWVPKHVAKPVRPTELLTSIADLLLQRYN